MKSALRVSVAVALVTPAVAQADVIIGPRFSYYFDNSNLRTSSIDETAIQGVTIDEEATRVLQEAFGEDVALLERQEGSGVLADQVAFPMIGGMVNFGDDRDRFTITGMYGQGTGSLVETSTFSRELSLGDVTFTDLGSLSAVGEIDTDRYDFEVTWQRRSSESFAFFAGARYERLETTSESFVRTTSSNTIEGIIRDAEAIAAGEEPPQAPLEQPPTETLVFQEGTLETFSVRAGVTAFVPFSSNGVAFFNGMVHASHQPDFTSRSEFVFPASGTVFDTTSVESRGETSFGPDFAVGAQFILTDSLALDMRYRAILFFPVAGEQSFEDARVNHGVNIGLSFRL